jgi:hypothetical protein
MLTILDRIPCECIHVVFTTLVCIHVLCDYPFSVYEITTALIFLVNSSL